MISLYKVHMPKAANRLVKKVLHSGYVAEGDAVRNFEKLLKGFLQRDNIITVNSCTNAVQLALELFGTREFNNYVLTTPMTCVATNAAVKNAGATPCWVDVSSQHGMITPEALREAYKEARFRGLQHKIAALIYVCWGGDLGPLQEVSRVCKELEIPLIVDAAQAFGIIPKDIADVVCYSFQAIKHITTGDGAAMEFKDADLMKRAMNLRWFGIDRDNFRTPSGEINWRSDIPEIGHKSHMNNIAGAIGVAQLQNFKKLQKRLETYQIIDRTITKWATSDVLVRSWTGPSASWVSTFNYKNPEKLRKYLFDYGIQASPMHVDNTIYSGLRDAITLSPLTGVKIFSEHHLCVPCGWWLKSSEVTKIIRRLCSGSKRVNSEGLTI